jgi:hypothetical protein
MDRVLEPEWLDDLPDSDPAAIHSRRDLRRLNAFMGNAGIIARALADAPPPKRVIDVGAGDGFVSVAVAQKLGWRGVEFVLVDRNATVPNETRNALKKLGCVVTPQGCDVLDGLASIGPAEVAFANLFLHHFTAPQLAGLLRALAARCRVFVACEPRRSRFALLGSRCVGLLGCNAVTRHDAVVSVRAGFSGQELSALWPDRSGWTLTERAGGRFSHLFVARRQ